MRLTPVVVALSLLALAAPLASAEPAPATGAAESCPYVTTFATVCVGGGLDSLASVRLLGGERHCL